MATPQPEAPARKLRWYQYSLRSLLLFLLLVSLGMSWVAVRMKRARRQEGAVEEIEKFGGWARYDYEVQQSNRPLPSAGPPGPAWLRNLLGEHFFATVVDVHLAGTQITDASLERLKRLTQLQTLDLWETKITDAGLEHLEGLTQLQVLDLWRAHVTDAGLKHLKGLTQLQTLGLCETKVTYEGVKGLQQAMPKCRIEW